MKLNLAGARIAWITRREFVGGDEFPSNHAWGTDRIFSTGAERVRPKRIRWLDALGARLRLGPNLSEQLWLFFNLRKFDFIIAKDTDLVWVLCGLLWLSRRTKSIFAFLHCPLRVAIKDFFLVQRCSRFLALSEKIHQLSLISHPRRASALVTIEWGVDIEFYDRLRAEVEARGASGSALPASPDGRLRILLIGITGRKFTSFLKATTEDRDLDIRVLTNSPEILSQIKSLPNYSSVRAVPNEEVTYRKLVEQYLACDVVAIPLDIKVASDAELIRSRATLWGITTLLESSALAKPVVMTFNPVIDFDVSAQKCGLCIHGDDPKDWMDAIRWCKANKEALKAMGEQARRHVEIHYIMKVFHQRLTQIIEDCLAED